MSGPRSEAFAALREAEESAKKLPEVLTVQTLAEFKAAMQHQATALRRALEWMDALENP